MTQPPQRQAALKFAYVDLPEVSETFADTIASLFFDGQTLRITFAANRLDPLQPPSQVSGKCYPVCRLVLSGAAMADLGNRMAQLGANIAQAQAQTASSQSN
jgi:hypothetical protein